MASPTNAWSLSKNSTACPIDNCVGNAGTSICATHFGIELESVLAFKKDPLESTISEYNLDTNIIKTPADYEHRSLLELDEITTNPSYDCRWRSPSWALHVPETDIVCQSKLHKSCSSTSYIVESNG
ncbi:uncharacterized protein Z519_04506 [Cladophialophora bantiana CBS 173.52]|uniref:Uncharacterized protein n=1 Tax=Cladophialophora bantiana (strain ATCC 10958 / CBS 173.52 / CDC B-1940 / NIH 8579) TaxID=1442370 RepID=A0A0D2HUL1_CLAB1|nr:uncharacterized protein Z519_04506 [Cladophialophora bantiana CBS 173.52]KIW94530.1 hypothetical protein Z519_04506 [Cladophialophora bantiana CBS 173.52]